MQAVVWLLLAITSLSLLARKEGIVFGWLFMGSAIIGFLAFGFIRGLGYFGLLLVGSLLFYLVERFLSMRVAARLAREDIDKEPYERPPSS